MKLGFILGDWNSRHCTTAYFPKAIELLRQTMMRRVRYVHQHAQGIVVRCRMPLGAKKSCIFVAAKVGWKQRARILGNRVKQLRQETVDDIW